MPQDTDRLEKEITYLKARVFLLEEIVKKLAERVAALEPEKTP